MEKKESDELKSKYELKSKAEKIEVETEKAKAPQEELQVIVDELYKGYQNGENVYAEIWSYYGRYNIYSCDFEGITKEEFLNRTQNTYDVLQRKEGVESRNGSYQLPEEMLESFKKGLDKVYLFKGHNGVHMIFDKHDLEEKTDEEFLEYANISLTGESREEKKQREEEISKKREEENKQQIEEIKEKIPQWFERGKTIIYPEKQKEWAKCVESIAKDEKGDFTIYAFLIENALEIMESLEKTGSLEEAQSILDSQNHSGVTESLVANLVLTFSKKGSEFYEDLYKSVYHEEIPEKGQERLSSQIRANEEYARAEEKRKQEYVISTTRIGKTTINTPTSDKKEAEAMENAGKSKDENELGE